MTLSISSSSNKLSDYIQYCWRIVFYHQANWNIFPFHLQRISKLTTETIVCVLRLCIPQRWHQSESLLHKDDLTSNHVWSVGTKKKNFSGLSAVSVIPMWHQQESKVVAATCPVNEITQSFCYNKWGLTLLDVSGLLTVVIGSYW